MAARLLNAQRRTHDIVVLGASAGGVHAMLDLLRLLPGDLPALLVLVLHRLPTPSNLACVLGRAAAFPVVEASDGPVNNERGLYVAPPDQHLVFTGAGLQVTNGPKQHSTRPAIDPLFVSAAAVHGPRVVGVVLSGCGKDGALGLAAIKRAGGLSLVQEPHDAMLPYMPQAAIDGDHPDAILCLELIAEALDEVTRGESYQPPS